MNRRGLMKAILAAGVAPYVCTTAGVLMPVRAVAPRQLWMFGESTIELEIMGDGITDDTAAIQAWINGATVLYQGKQLGNRLENGTFKIKSTIDATKLHQPREVIYNHFIGPVDGPMFKTDV